MKLLHKIAKDAERLSYLEMVKLDEVIHRLLNERAAGEVTIRERADREVVKREKVGHITYQLERVRCGKTNCKCVSGELHGPYWYGYYSQDGKTVSVYIGKNR